MGKIPEFQFSISKAAKKWNLCGGPFDLWNNLFLENRSKYAKVINGKVVAFVSEIPGKLFRTSANDRASTIVGVKGHGEGEWREHKNEKGKRK